MIGEHIPYSISNDNLILTLYIASLLFGSYTLMRDGSSIVERIKNMFYYKGQSTPYNTRTGISKIGSFTLYASSVLYATIITFAHLQKTLPTEQKGSIAIFATIALFFVLFLAGKFLLYEIIIHILFSSKQASEWTLSYFFTIKTSCILLLPLVSAIILVPTLSETLTLIYVIIIGIIYLIVLSLRCFNIIFNETFYFSDIFLYLCAIELLPLLLLWEAIEKTHLFIMIIF